MHATRTRETCEASCMTGVWKPWLRTRSHFKHEDTLRAKEHGNYQDEGDPLVLVPGLRHPGRSGSTLVGRMPNQAGCSPC